MDTKADNISKATYRIDVWEGNWVVVRTHGTLTQILPERFPHKRLTAARKYLEAVSSSDEF